MNYFFGGPGGIPACRQAGEPPKAYASRFILPRFVEDGILFRETDETVCLMFFWWAGRDSNPRRRMPADLQSAPFDRFGTDPSCKTTFGYHRVSYIDEKQI